MASYSIVFSFETDFTLGYGNYVDVAAFLVITVSVMTVMALIQTQIPIYTEPTLARPSTPPISNLPEIIARLKTPLPGEEPAGTFVKKYIQSLEIPTGISRKYHGDVFSKKYDGEAADKASDMVATTEIGAPVDGALLDIPVAEFNPHDAENVALVVDLLQNTAPQAAEVISNLIL